MELSLHVLMYQVNNQSVIDVETANGVLEKLVMTGTLMTMTDAQILARLTLAGSAILAIILLR